MSVIRLTNVANMTIITRSHKGGYSLRVVTMNATYPFPSCIPTLDLAMVCHDCLVMYLKSLKAVNREPMERIFERLNLERVTHVH